MGVPGAWEVCVVHWETCRWSTGTTCSKVSAKSCKPPSAGVQKMSDRQTGTKDPKFQRGDDARDMTTSCMAAKFRGKLHTAYHINALPHANTR